MYFWKDKIKKVNFEVKFAKICFLAIQVQGLKISLVHMYVIKNKSPQSRRYEGIALTSQFGSHHAWCILYISSYNINNI